MQIADQLADAIQNKHLLNGQKLPGSRKLATLIGVHRNTVTLSYEILEAQGWVISHPGRGTFVNYTVPDKELTNFRMGFPEKTGFNFKQWTLLDNVFGQGLASIRMDDGLPDIRMTHLDQLARLFHTNMKRRSTLNKLGAENQAAHFYYREQLTQYLNRTRGLGISTQQVMVTRSMELGLNIVAETLLTHGDVVLVGDLSYFSVNMILQKAGAEIVTIPVDEYGIRPDAVRRICQNKTIRLLYLTSHYHYPTTVTLSQERRAALLQLAQEFGFIILEDDYDFDFNYNQKPTIPLAAMDNGGMVVYIGTFGRSMPTAFRSGYIIAPDNLILEMEKLNMVMDRFGDPLGELALGELIEDGYIYKYLMEYVGEYHRRRDVMAQELVVHLGDVIDFQIPDGGLAMWTSWPSQFNLMKFSKACANEGLLLPPYLLYQTRQFSGVRLGFGSLNSDEIQQAVQIMKSVSSSSKIM